MDPQDWPLVSALFITYKRLHSLERSIKAFLDNTEYPNVEVVIADDGSGPEIQAQIRTLPADVFALSPTNRGLGANNNNGIRHCSGQYILMIQDDWICHGPPGYLYDAISVLHANPSVGLINFAGAPHAPDLSQRLAGSNEPCYVTPEPFSRSNKREFLYSDQPHIHTRSALDYVGPYMEDRDMEKCETDYNIRWENQNRFRTAVFPAYYNRVFICAPNAVSFRTTRFRYKVDAALMPIATFSKRYCKPLYKAGRKTVRTVVTAMERLRIVR